MKIQSTKNLFLRATTPLLLCAALVSACSNSEKVSTASQPTAEKVATATQPTVVDISEESALLSTEEKKELEVEKAVENNEKTIRRMLADDTAFYGKAVTLTTPLEVATYYNYRYRDSKDTHYSFKVGEYPNYFYAYGPKEQFAEIFEEALDNENTLFEIEVTTSKKNRDNKIWTLRKAKVAE